MNNYHYLSGFLLHSKFPYIHGNSKDLSSWKYNRPFIMVNYQLLVAKIGANSFDIQFPSNYKIQWNLHKPTPVGHENIVGLCNAIYITLAATLVSVAWLSF